MNNLVPAVLAAFLFGAVVGGAITVNILAPVALRLVCP